MRRGLKAELRRLGIYFKKVSITPDGNWEQTVFTYKYHVVELSRVLTNFNEYYTKGSCWCAVYNYSKFETPCGVPAPTFGPEGPTYDIVMWATSKLRARS